jgi:hypothetical protein
MPDNYWNVLNKALKTVKYFYSLDFENAFTLLYTNSFKSNQPIVDVKNNSNKLKDILFEKHSVTPNDYTISNIDAYLKSIEQKNGDYEFISTDIVSLINYLDFIIRVWIGQWENLTDIVRACKYESKEFFISKESEIAKCRNSMFPIFKEKGVDARLGTSLGIYSDVFCEDVIILYGIYKALKFSISGSYADKDFVRKSDKPVYIQFPYKETFVVSSYEATKEWLDNHPMPGEIATRQSYIADEETKQLYVYVNMYHSVLVEPDDKIFVCENRNLKIEKKIKYYRY